MIVIRLSMYFSRRLRMHDAEPGKRAVAGVEVLDWGGGVWGGSMRTRRWELILGF